MKNLTFVFVLSSILAVAQPNCNVFKMENNESCYTGCETAIQAVNSRQGSRQSQELFDQAIELCPALDYAYMEKAVPYLKAGDFVTWKVLIDKAVDLNPKAHLGYRGWCRYQFLRDYKGAIKDLERLDSLVKYDIGHSANGEYHLEIARALCYKALGEKKKAIEVIETHIAGKDYTPGLYDFLHLGVLKLEIADYNGAIVFLQKQIAANEKIAETYFYLAQAYKGLNSPKACRDYLNMARIYYSSGYKLSDPYTHPMDKIWMQQIESEMLTAAEK